MMIKVLGNNLIKSALLSILLLSVITTSLPKADAAPTVSFNAAIQLENAAGTTARDPSIAVAGDLVWVVWSEDTAGTTKIMMRNSTDAGATFGTVTDLTLNSPTTPPLCDIAYTDFDCRGFPKVYANGTNAYVVWQDSSTYAGGGVNSDFLGDVFYRKISYSSPTTWTITPSLSSAPQIVNGNPGSEYALGPVVSASATGGYVHVIWSGLGPGTIDDNLYHARSTDSGATFTGTITNLSPGIATDSIISNPDITVDGSNVYAVWEDYIDDGTPSADILFSASSDNGDTFNGGTSGSAGNPKNLVTNSLVKASLDTKDSLNPQIAAAGGNAYVVWSDASGATTEIFYRNSTDVGVTFGPALSTSATVLSTAGGNNEVQPQIGTNSDGSKVFVAWAESTSNDIKFKRSVDSGVTFSAVQTIDSAGTDNSPKLDNLDDNVYIVWQDTSVGGSGDIFFTSSSDGGATFANKQNLSNDATLSSSPQLDSASSHVVWIDDPAGNADVLTKSGVFGYDLSWDATDYRLSETANITLLTGSGLGTTDVTVTSSSDGVGFTKTLTETSTGTYTGSITFSETATTPGSSILKVAVGGTITVTKDATSTNANIYPRTIAWDADPYTKGDGKVGGTNVRFTVTDQHSNVNPLVEENISVSISSLLTGDIISITAKETGIDTGLFKNDNLIFSTGINTVSVDDTVTISQIGADGAGYAADPAINTINMNVKSTTFPAGFNLVLTETSGTSNNFKGTLKLNSTGPSAGTTIQVAGGDVLSLTYNAATENFLISDNPNPRIGSLSSSVGDTVTATWQAASDTVSVTNDGAGGGGGGGVSRAGLVVQALGALAVFGGGSGGTAPPSFTDENFSIKGDEITFSQGTESNVNSNFKVGKESNLQLGFKMLGGLNALDHIGLYANIGPGQDKYDSDTYLYFDRFKTPQITIHDPHGFFKFVDLDVTEPTKSNIDVKFVFDFAKSLENNDVIFEAWNIKRESALKEIPDLLNVQDDTKAEIEENELESVEDQSTKIQQKEQVPKWIKSNAGWWGEGNIDDDTFTNGIGYLLQKKIIAVPELLKENVSPDKTLDEEPEKFTPVVPSWVKNNALWWSQDQLTDDDFLSGIKYLLEKGIIQVRV